MVCCKLTLAALAVAVAGWSIFCAGVGALHTACNRDELDPSTRSHVYDASGIPSHDSCAHTFGWAWWVVFFDLGALAIAATSLLSTKARGLHLGALAALSIAAVYVMQLTAAFINLHYLLPHGVAAIVFPAPLTARGTKGAMAGTMISATIDVLLCLLIGWHADKLNCSEPTPSDVTCRNTATTTASDPPQTAPTATASQKPDPASAQAFQVKVQAAAACTAV